MADHPITLAVRKLRAEKIPFKPHLYAYVEKGGTRASSEALGVPEHEVIKTLVFERDDRQPLIVLMHGDRQVSPGALARQLGTKSVKPCDPAMAERHTGYKVGGTSPFGTRKALPVYVEKSILDLDRIYINGGARGFLVEISPADLVRVLGPEPVEVGISG